MNKVQYKAISGFDDYKVGDDGSIWSSKTNSEWRSLKCYKSSYGYLLASLRKNKETFRIQVHRVVLMEFVGPCPEGMECRHLNGIKHDNRLSNLMWGTRRENLLDRARLNQGDGFGDAHYCAILTCEIVTECRKSARNGRFVTDLAHEYGVGYKTMLEAVKGYSWKHVQEPPVKLKMGGKRKNKNVRISRALLER